MVHLKDYEFSALNSAIKKIGLLLKNNNFVKADLIIKKLLKRHPGNVEVLYLAGVSSANFARYDKSEFFFTEAVKLQPNFFPALNSLAMLYYERCRFAEALVKYNKVISFKTDQAELFNNRGNVLRELKSFDEALADFSKAITLKPDFIGAFYNRGNALRELCQFDEALADFNKAISLKPDFAGAFYNRGNILKELHRFDEALADFNKAIALRPSYAEAFNNRGVIKKELKYYGDALADYSKAISLKPDFAGAFYNRGNILKELHRFDEALVDLNRAIFLKPEFAGAYNSRGNVLKELYQAKEALVNFNKALSLEPKYADAANSRGIVLTEIGRFDEALLDFSKVVFLQPDCAAAHRQISTLKKYTKSDPQFTMMKNLILKKSLSKNDKCELFYALGKASEDQGDFYSAFNYFKKGGKLRKEILSYSIEQDKNFFSNVKKIANQVIQNVKVANKVVTKIPIFILGMPRSGTTLVEQIISSHSEVFGAGELAFWGQYGAKVVQGGLQPDADAIQALRDHYLRELQKVAKSHCFVTDKMPNNFRFIGLILSAFPEAKIINTQREPAAVCWSNYKNYFVSNNLGYSYDLDDIVNYYLLYKDLMRFWKNFYGDYIYSLNYEQLTSNSEKEIRKLINFIGLGWEDACLAPQNNKRIVRTASFQQVNKKIYGNSSEAWRQYEPYLGKVFDDL